MTLNTQMGKQFTHYLECRMTQFQEPLHRLICLLCGAEYFKNGF